MLGQFQDECFQVFQSRILIQRTDPIFEEDKDQNWKHEYGGKLFFHVDWNVLLLKPKKQKTCLDSGQQVTNVTSFDFVDLC